MNNTPDKLLSVLDDEIDKKCFELKKKRKKLIFQEFFIIACAIFIILPFLFIFLGINLLTLCLPALLFIAASTIAISPLLIKNTTGDVFYE